MSGSGNVTRVNRIELDSLRKIFSNNVAILEEAQTEFNNACDNYLEVKGVMGSIRGPRFTEAKNEFQKIIEKFKEIEDKFSNFLVTVGEAVGEEDERGRSNLENAFTGKGLTPVSNSVGQAQDQSGDNSIQTGRDNINNEIKGNLDQDQSGINNDLAGRDNINNGQLQKGRDNLNQVDQSINGDGNYQAGRDMYIQNQRGNGGNTGGGGGYTPRGNSGGSYTPSTPSTPSTPRTPSTPSIPDTKPTPSKPTPSTPEVPSTPKVDTKTPSKYQVAGGAAQSKVNLVNNVPGGGGGGSYIGGTTYNYNYGTPAPAAPKANLGSPAPAPAPSAGLNNSGGAFTGGDTQAIADHGSNAVAQTGLLNDNSNDIVASIIDDSFLNDRNDYSGNSSGNMGNLNKTGLGLLGLGTAGLGYGVYKYGKNNNEDDNKYYNA